MKQRQPKQWSKRPRFTCEEGELRDRGPEKLRDRSFQENHFPGLSEKLLLLVDAGALIKCIESCF